MANFNNGLIICFLSRVQCTSYYYQWTFPIAFTSYHNVFTCGYLGNTDMRLQGYSILPNLSDLASVLIRTDAAAPSLNMFAIGI